MTENAYTPEQLTAITEYVDVTTSTPPEATALFIFGTNQVLPVDIAIDRHLKGLAPLIITTGGVNRHNGVVEGREFRRQLIERGADADCIRCEDQSTNTWENVEFSLPYLREALSMRLPITVICKWYHRRAIQCLRTLLPEAEAIYAITFEPVYSNVPITRTNWMDHPDGKRRVIREWQEVERRVADGSYLEMTHAGDAWR
ncbi:YdcF family protein [Actinophytocola sp.]|uniref:YdcF family protein n=1 Tax=Actinophytocola sp. TaxID=1872138 RepID=UPI0025C0F174|nr:YdcF family protein [Actinophytocola sp.]